MSNVSNALKNVQEKIQILAKQQANLKKENGKLKEELQAATSNNKNLQGKLDELQQQISILKMNASSLGDSDKKELEKRITLYIKEIDRCIASLGA
jgi:chromosome segregation ATPase